MDKPEHFDLDLDNSHWLEYFGFHPDRELNPKYAGVADMERAGALIRHPTLKTKRPCASAVHFDTPQARRVFEGKQLWKVEQAEPLTLSPSIKCACGDHGYVRQGKWEAA